MAAADQLQKTCNALAVCVQRAADPERLREENAQLRMQLQATNDALGMVLFGQQQGTEERLIQENAQLRMQLEAANERIAVLAGVNHLQQQRIQDLRRIEDQLLLRAQREARDNSRLEQQKDQLRREKANLQRQNDQLRSRESRLEQANARLRDDYIEN